MNEKWIKEERHRALRAEVILYVVVFVAAFAVTCANLAHARALIGGGS